MGGEETRRESSPRRERNHSNGFFCHLWHTSAIWSLSCLYVYNCSSWCVKKTHLDCMRTTNFYLAYLSAHSSWEWFQKHLEKFICTWTCQIIWKLPGLEALCCIAFESTFSGLKSFYLLECHSETWQEFNSGTEKSIWLGSGAPNNRGSIACGLQMPPWPIWTTDVHIWPALFTW